jgi:ribosomal subunit interface protein
MGNYKFFFKGVRIDERTEEYIKKRLNSLEKLLDKILQIEVEIDLDKKGKFRVEVMIKTPYKLYRSEEITESIEGSVDIVENELKTQITKDKGKRKTLIKRGGRSLKKKITLDENARF